MHIGIYCASVLINKKNQQFFQYAWREQNQLLPEVSDIRLLSTIESSTDVWGRF